MARNKGSKGDWRRYLKFEQENEKLRKEVTKLRKIINNLVIDQLEKREEKVNEGKPVYEKACSCCGNSDICRVPISRPDGEFEVIICYSCNHRENMRQAKNKTK